MEKYIANGHKKQGVDSLKNGNWWSMGTLANQVPWSIGNTWLYNDKKRSNQIP